jgi:signal transduction histidine kinase
MQAVVGWAKRKWQLDGVPPEPTRRIRVMTLVSLGILAVGLPFIGQYWMLGVRWMSVAVAVTVLAGLANLLWLYRTLDYKTAGTIGAFLLFVLLLLSNWASGGFYDPNFGWLYTLPIFAALLVNARAGWVFTALVLLVTVLFWYAPTWGIQIPNRIPEEMQAVQSLANRVSAILAIGILLGALDSQQYFSQRLLREAHRDTQLETQQRLQMQRQLAHSDRMASMGRLSAGLAHEINNPLTYVMGNLSIAQSIIEQTGHISKEQGADLLELIEDTAHGTRRICDLVKDLRDFTREPDDAEPIDVNEALDMALKMLAGDIRHRALLVEERTRGLFVVGSQGRLIQVFVNIVKNACQAIPAGKAQENRITVRTRRHEEQAVIEVSDTGNGMDAETRKKLFDPFYSTKAPGEGMGLGMAICHGIVSALGGRMTVDSAVGEGSTFSVWLPLTSPERVSEEPSVIDAGAERAPKALRILIVDDEPAILRSLQKLLAEHEVTTESNPRHALVRVASVPFDVILCDVMMPDLTGMQFYDELARHQPGWENRVLFMTGGVLIPEVRRFIGRDEVMSIEKPIKAATLRAAIRKRFETAGRAPLEGRPVAETPDG